MNGMPWLDAENTLQDDNIRELAMELAALPAAETYNLLAAAGRVTRENHGRRVELCTIVNAKSGRCSEDCAFCAQSAHHGTNAKVHGILPAEEVLRHAVKMEQAGVARFSLVTSGRGVAGRDLDEIIAIVRLLKRETGLQVCASLGIIGENEAAMLKQAGVSTYHHNLETAPDYYRKICTTHDYRARIKTIEAAMQAGLRVCAGGILGLGENMIQRVEMALELRRLGIDSVPLNIINPIPGTPLETARVPSPLEVIMAITLFRLIMPRAIIRLCGGRREGLRSAQALAFVAGANGLMVGDYLTTRGGSLEDDLAMLADLGSEPC